MKEPPFKVGDRIRVKTGDRRGAWKKVPTGVILFVVPPETIRGGGDWLFIVLREGTKQARGGFRVDAIDLIPVVDFTLDQTAQSLADAVKAGDVNAALVLADRVFELCGATRL